MWSAIATAIGTTALVLGLLLATIGLFGLLRTRDVFLQLHAAGLITGPATLLVLLGSVATGSAEIITSAALVGAFVLVTSSLSSHAIAQAALHRASTTGPSDLIDPAEGHVGDGRMRSEGSE